ncbi:hypothetical protein DL93DRAFT_2157746 [Clavulina sp. PMI_390]|nr:hypothetical protein DL93DRAFT_2157746 [Clavulina sp. PMI_390]
MSSDMKANFGEEAKPVAPRKFSHKFWSPEMQPFRKIYMKGMIGSFVIVIIVMWVTMSVYWGSLAHQRSYSHRLAAFYVDHDNSTIGQSLRAVIENNIANQTHYKLGWRIVSPSDWPTNEAAAAGVQDELAWVIVMVQPNATANLIAARAAGDTSYDPTQSVLAFYSQARNEQATSSYTLPYTQALLTQALTEIGNKMTGDYLASIGGNATAIAAAAKAPQTLANPVWFTMVDIRQFSAPVATAVLLVGSIYLIIFTFTVTMGGYGARAPIEQFLTTSELLKLRLAAPMILYFPLSLSFAMISLPYKVPFGAKYSYGGGFFLYWVFVYLTMAAVGLGNEFTVQLLGPKFIPFYLVAVIICNVSVASLPIDLEPWFYKYGYGFPVFNMSLAVRTIIFNVRSHLGRNAGVLIGWVLLSIVTITVISLMQRRKAVRSHQAETIPAGGLEGGAFVPVMAPSGTTTPGTISVMGDKLYQQSQGSETSVEEERNSVHHDRQ